MEEGKKTEKGKWKCGTFSWMCQTQMYAAGKAHNKQKDLGKRQANGWADGRTDGQGDR